MKFLTLLFISVVLTGCIGASTNFTNRSITYQYTPSIEGKSNTLKESPTAGQATVNAEKTNDIDTTANTAEQQNLNK